MVYSPRHQGPLLVLPSTKGSDTWVLRNGQWRELRSMSSDLPERCGAAAAYDPASGETVVFGGCNAGCGSSTSDGCGGPYDDTWLWNPNDGWRLATVSTTPPARGLHAMTHDAASGGVIMLGGYGEAGRRNDVWVYSNGDWARRPTLEASLDARSSHHLGHDGSGLVVVAGTRTTGREAFVVRHDGAQWQPVCAAGGCDVGGVPEPVVGFHGDGRALLFGDHLFTSDTWRWNGSGWAVTSTVGPQWRRRTRMIYDDRRDEMLLYGGWAQSEVGVGGAPASCAAGTAICDDLWIYDGTWRSPSTSDADGDGGPPPLYSAALSMHGDEGLLVSGGTSDDAAASDAIWRYDTGFDERPGHVARFVFGSAGTRHGETILGGTVRWCGSATGGLALHAWARDRWAPLTTSDDGAGCKVWDADPGALELSIVGSERAVFIAATPVDTNGDGDFARIETRYVEVAIRHRVR